MKEKIREIGRRGYSINETCATLGISRSTVWRLEKAGKLRVIAIGRRRIVPESEIDRLLSGDKAA